MKTKLLGLVLCGAFAAQAQDQTYDARSLAMGGAGVAISNTRNAAFLNPSALASGEDKFAWEFPIISARVLDEKKLLSDTDNLKTSANNLTAALQNFQNAQAALQANPTNGNATAALASATAAGAALSSFNASLNTVSGKSLTGGVFAGTMLGIPSKNYAFALTLDARAELGAQFNYAASDSNTVLNLSNALTTCGAANPANPGGVVVACQTAAAGVGANGTVNNLQSKLLARGVVAKDIGITMAHRFDIQGNTDIGITPKFTQLRTFDLVSSAQSGNGISTNNGAANERSESIFNIDLGVARSLQKTEDHEIKAGLVVKDMLSRSVKTVLNNNIDIKPRATVGIGYLTKLVAAGADLDLVSNKPMIAGFGSQSQFLRLGAEFDAWKWAQIRIGYRHDLKGNYKGLPSIGLGLSPFGVHFDLSVAAASKSEVAAALQFGLNF
jgi:hypothetical protein